MKPPTSPLGEYLLTLVCLKAERSQAVCAGVNAPTASGRDVRRVDVSLIGFIFFNITIVILVHILAVLSNRFSETQISLKLLQKVSTTCILSCGEEKRIQAV